MIYSCKQQKEITLGFLSTVECFLRAKQVPLTSEVLAETLRCPTGVGLRKPGPQSPPLPRAAQSASVKDLGLGLWLSPTPPMKSPGQG